MSVKSRDTMIGKFFPDASGRKKASREIDRKASELLASYPPELVEKIRRLKNRDKPLKEIYQTLGEDPRILEIAMHLAVKHQAIEIGGEK